MNLIPPHRTKSKPVESWKQIKKDAQEMIELLDSRSFANRTYTDAFAIHHSQVSETPLNFFVLHIFYAKKHLRKRVIINAEILEKNHKKLSKEGCLSYLFRPEVKIKRYDWVKVRYQVPGFFGLKTMTEELTDLTAQVWQHEIDHGNGVFMIDHVPKKRR